MPGVDFNRLREEIKISEVLDRLDFVAVEVNGDQLRGGCPVHKSSSPTSRTFSVNTREGRYYCHKCGSKGNQLELWAKVNKLSIFDAAIDLCRTLGREVPWVERW